MEPGPPQTKKERESWKLGTCPNKMPPMRKKLLPCMEKLPVFSGLCWLLSWWEKSKQLKAEERRCLGEIASCPMLIGFFNRGKKIFLIIISYLLLRQKPHCSKLPSWWLSQVLILSSYITFVTYNSTPNIVYKEEIEAMTAVKERKKVP